MIMDHYMTLGVSRTATQEEIKKAYRKLAMEHHPDRGGDLAKFQEISVAYEILGDADKRAAYDRPPQPSPQFGPGGFSFSFNGFDLNEFFAQSFGGPQNFAQNRQPQKPVFRTRVSVSLQDAFSGAEQVLQLGTPNGVKVVNVKVPPGISSRSSIRYDNLIEEGTLIIEFHVLDDLRFDRKGDDLYTNIPISVLDLIVGTKIEFTTIGGNKIEVYIPAGTQTYHQFRLPGYGMPTANNGYGDQILLLKVIVPANIDNDIIESIKRSRSK
jgi:DnaJ-class molecular chaperone